MEWSNCRIVFFHHISRHCRLAAPSLLLQTGMTPPQDAPAYNSGSPGLSWEIVQRYLPLSPGSRPSLMEHDRALSSVLSATSYPLAGRPVASRRAQEDIPDSELPLYGGILLESSSQEDDHADISPSREEGVVTDTPHSRTLSKRQRYDDATAGSSTKKRGRPRKNAGYGEETSTSEVC